MSGTCLGMTVRVLPTEIGTWSFLSILMLLKTFAIAKMWKACLALLEYIIIPLSGGFFDSSTKSLKAVLLHNGNTLYTRQFHLLILYR